MKQNKFPILIASVQWYLTTVFQIDRYFFTYDVETLYFFAIKLLYFFTLIILWSFLFHFYHQVAEGNTTYIRWFKIFIIYFSILMVILLFLWPGTWAWDDIWALLREERRYGWTAWQHVLTGIYQEILLQILPFPGGLILLQNAAIALGAAFSIVKLENSFDIPKLKNTYLDIIIKLLPFLTPPVLMYQFSGYRIGLYVYVELIMLVIWICSNKDRYEWSWKYLMLFSVLCAIAATWRTESFLYIPMVILGILFAKKPFLNSLKKFVCILLILGVFSAINHVQNIHLGNNSYKIISILRPCAELVHVADRKEDAALLEEISQAINIDVIYNNPEMNGEKLYWSCGVVKQEHTEEDYHRCLIAFVKLCLKYPRVVIHERCKLFIISSGITGEAFTNEKQTYNFFETNSGNDAAEAMKNADLPICRPVFPTLRKALIHLFNVQIGDYVYALKRVIWNIIPPLLILLYAWCKALQKRNWHILWIMTAVLVKFPIVVLTQPSGWFMYFLSFYFLGYVMLILGILFYWGKCRK